MHINEICKYLDEKQVIYNYIGSMNSEIDGFSSLKRYREGTLTWIKNESTYDECKRLKNIRAAIVEEGVNVDFDNALYVDGSKEVFFSIVRRFWGSSICKENQIGCGTYISQNVVFGNGVKIGHNCSLDGNITVGSNTVIENNVVIQGNVNIGSDCLIHSGAVIGCDGFGYYFSNDGTIGKVEHFGGVSIGEKVEIGACACIDRGTIDNTEIGNNTKIDNLVHIAHNVQIGNNVCVVAGAIVCGSAELMDYSYVAPGGIVRNQTTIGKNGFVALGACSISDVKDNMVVAGVPAKEMREVLTGDK